MSSQDEEMLVGSLETYYLQKSEKVTKEEATQIVKIAESYAKSNRAQQFVKLTFSLLKKHLKKDNFAITSKRFLILLDELL